MLDHAVAALDAAPSTVIDLGSGTGAGTVTLAQRFPTARVHGLDVSAALLDRAAAAAAGVDERIERHRVDLDGDWSAAVPAGVDFDWAALTLHHVADPAGVLQQVFASLRPGGVFVVTELTGRTAFDPGDLGGGREGLGDRMPSAHGHHAEHDWQQLLEEAGFSPVRRHDHEFLARRYRRGGSVPGVAVAIAAGTACRRQERR